MKHLKPGTWRVSFLARWKLHALDLASPVPATVFIPSHIASFINIPCSNVHYYLSQTSTLTETIQLAKRPTSAGEKGGATARLTMLMHFRLCKDTIYLLHI